MKRTFTLGIMGLALLLSSCNSEEKMIQKAAMGYLDAMGNYRIAEAEQFASKETIETTLTIIQKNIMPNMDSSYIKRNTPATIEILEVNIQTDTTAVVNYKKTTPIKVQEGSLNLVKRDEKWQAVVAMNAPSSLLIPTDSASVSSRQKMMEKKTLSPSKELPEKFQKGNVNNN
ncbi:MAG: hypothetical protein MJZ39_00500 [Bacteroidales bacterium]|nr:hypothetical protein [Bacteroidales bacterium]